MTKSYLVPWFFTDCAKKEHWNRPFFLFDFLLYHYSDFWHERSLLYYGKFKKKSRKNRNKLQTKYPKNHENFKKSGKWLDNKAKIIFKIYDVTDWQKVYGPILLVLVIKKSVTCIRSLHEDLRLFLTSGCQARMYEQN